MGKKWEPLQVQVQEGLLKVDKEIPCCLLYDQRGSELYEKITELEEYYPFRVEECMLQELAHDIAAQIPENSVIVELGCGTARKSAILLSAVQILYGRCRYVGIDVSSSFLQEARSNLLQEVVGIDPNSIDMVEAEYMEGLRKVRAMYPCDNLCIAWLGSTVGNLTDEDAIQFFRDIFAAVGDRSQIFLCADMWKDTSKLYAAYHDKEGITELFIKNGMRCALRLLGHNTTAAEEDKWLYEVVVNESLRQVEMYLKFAEELAIPDSNIYIRRGEGVLVEVSRKFTVGDFNRLANAAGFHIDVAWRNGIWGMQMLIPFKEAFERCWARTDHFFLNVPDWCEKPIDVRHPFKFYYGHIQAFAKLKLLPDDPASLTDTMFSRGIDPNVVDPSKCHSHPQVPPEWPTRAEIEDYVLKTRKKLLRAWGFGDIPPRLVILALEHEYMHLETLAYMRAQDRKTAFEKTSRANGVKTNANLTSKKLASIGHAKNVVSICVANDDCHDVHTNCILEDELSDIHINGQSSDHSNGVSRSYGKGTTAGAVHNVAQVGNENISCNGMVYIAPGEVTLGGNLDDGSFMWDNEYPQFTTIVSKPFWVSCKPVTVGEFNAFVEAGGYRRADCWDPLDFSYFQRQKITAPATWSEIDGEFFVHDSYKTEHWTCVANEPVYASLSEAEAYCTWSGGRVMTEPEYQLILNSKEASKVEKLRTSGWEWTSTPFEPFPGYVKMPEYPEYSSDFFDGSHYVLKGASPVTHRCMWRDTFRNFYQRQYPYVFAKFRVCKQAI